MSQFIYNGIEMGYPKVGPHSYTPEFAEDGSYKWTRVDLTVAGLINPAGMSYQGSPPVATPGVLAPLTVEAIRSVLLQPRGQLIYDVTGEQMVYSPGTDPDGNPATCDVNNGPFPGQLSLTRMDGTKGIACKFSISTYIIECPGQIEPTSLVTNTYSQSHSHDDQQICTITTTGQAFFRSDILEYGDELADDYREMLNVPVPKGFRRVAARFVITPMRNALTYVYLDVEQMLDIGETDPRVPGLNANGGLTGSGVLSLKAEKMVTSTGALNGVVSYLTMNSVVVTAIGSKMSSLWRMTQTAYAVATSLLPIGDLKTAYIKQISVRQSSDRVIGLHVDMLVGLQQNAKVAGINADLLRIDQIVPDKQGVNPAFLTRDGTAGTYSNELKASAWLSICAQPDQGEEGPYDDDASPGLPSTKTGPIVEVFTSDVLPDIEQNSSESTATSAYTKYEINTSYDIDNGILECPIAAPTKSSSTTTTVSSQGQTSPYDDEIDPTILYGVQGPPPVSRPDGPDAEFLTVSRPTTRMVVDIVASRVGSVPALADLNLDPNLVLMKVIPAFKSPEPLPDGINLMFYASATYIYGMKRSKQLGDPLNFGCAPYTNLSSADNFFPKEAFVDGIGDGMASDPDGLGNIDGNFGGGGGGQSSNPPGTVT